MPTKGMAHWLVGGALLAVCGFATWKSVQHARAELLTATGTIGGLAQAIRIEPGDFSLVALTALTRANNGDESAAADDELRRASALNPFNSELVMTLGMRAEFRGDIAGAERYLTQAAEMNHAFIPALTLANFCYRNNRPEKFRAMARRCLSLDPLNFDASPVFRLAWAMSQDSKETAALLPRSGPVLFQYLQFLIGTGRVDAAVEFWPRISEALDTAVPWHREIAVAYVESLAEKNRTAAAVRTWNQLVKHGFLRGKELDPANGVFVADPEFVFASAPGTFNWRVFQNDGVVVTTGRTGARVEFDGNQNQSLVIFATTAAALPGKSYRLRWNADASELTEPADPGFFFRITQGPGGGVTECPMLTAKRGACVVSTAPEGEQLRIEAGYTRAPGTTRAQGVLRLSGIRLEAGS